MNNALFIKVLSGELVVNFRVDQDYSDMANIAPATVLQSLGEGQTLVGYAVAEAVAVKEHMDTYELVSSDFSVAAKEDVPGGNLIFTPYGVALGDIPAEQPVLYGTQP